MNKQILDKVREIINYIEKSDDYQKYLLLKEKMHDDKEINTLLDEIRVLQKSIVNKRGNIKELEESINEKNQLLSDNPLYRDYLNRVDSINNVFNIIENDLNKYFSDKLNS